MLSYRYDREGKPGTKPARGENTMTDKKELLEAARMLKEHCEQSRCYQCIFNDSGSMDCVLDQQPCDYDLPEEGAEYE